MSFKHYILCRYNLTLFGENVYKVKDPAGWMERRRYYFDILLTSLSIQSCKNFDFVLFVDPNTPQEYIDDLEGMMDDRLSMNYEITTLHWEDWVKETEIKSEWLITSRIDNDDYYHEDFVKTIQESFNSTREVLDVHHLQFNEADEEFYTSGRPKPNSPFISLVEKRKRAVTVFEKQHSFMINKYPARFVGDTYLSIQVIHGENVSNKIRGEKL